MDKEQARQELNKLFADHDDDEAAIIEMERLIPDELLEWERYTNPRLLAKWDAHDAKERRILQLCRMFDKHELHDLLEREEDE